VTLKDDNKEEVFAISGVLRDVPPQSTLQFNIVIPFSKFLITNSWANETGVSANQIWVSLKENVNFSSVKTKIKDLIKTQKSTLNQQLFLIPLKEKILYTYSGKKRVWKEMRNVVIAGSIGLAILLARGLNVGFNTMFNGDIYLRFNEFKVILAFTLIALFTGLFSGLLPSLYLASSNPVSILKSKIITGHSYSFLRLSLIVFQFVIPVVLIICMMIVKVQERFMNYFDIGFEKIN
jgi:hypothetical protein